MSGRGRQDGDGDGLACVYAKLNFSSLKFASTGAGFEASSGRSDTKTTSVSGDDAGVPGAVGNSVGAVPVLG